MALTKTTENDKIEIVDKWFIQIRSATIIKEDGVELSRSFNRHVLQPGRLDARDILVETDISGENSQVQAICNAVWTTQIKADFKAFQIANKPA